MAKPGWRRWAPGASAAIFLWMPVLALIDRDFLLRDPGTGWHLVTGRLILETGQIPRSDPFSFTCGGQPWLSFEWLFQLLGALVERAGGLPLFTMSCALVLALVPVIVFRRSVLLGAGLPSSLISAFAVQLVLMGHAHGRPHVVTYALFAWISGWLYALDSGRAGWRSAAWMLPVFALWANLHGGFVAGLVLLGAFCATAGLRLLQCRSRARLRLAGRWLALGLCAALATLANPRGWSLHSGILEAMGMECLSFWDEFRSPDFLNGGTNIRIFEMILLGWMLVAFRGRLRLAELIVPAVFLYFSLQSVRNVTLFCILAAPVVARGMGAVLRGLPRVGGTFGAAWLAIERDALRCRAWMLIVAFAFLCAAPLDSLGMRKDLAGIRLSRGSEEFIRNNLSSFRRPFNAETLGGPLIYVFWPQMKVFVDDRFADLYHDEFMIGVYLKAASGGADWKDVLDRWGVTSAILPQGAKLANLLRESPEWKEVHADDWNALFLRHE